MGSLICFIHTIFRFLVTFGDEVTKILCNLCLHFARQDGQDGKKWKENHTTKVTKKPKSNLPKYVMSQALNTQPANSSIEWTLMYLVVKRDFVKEMLDDCSCW